MTSDSNQASSLIEEDEIVTETENFVLDVETKIQKRLEQARKNKQDVEESKQSKQNENYRWSPPVIGAEYIEPRYSYDRIRLKLSSELPGGKDNLRIKVPSEKNMEDKSTELNRLLSYYDIELEEISDLIGKRIPIREKGDTIKIDYPPISTIPNNVKYSCRRFAEKYGLVRWGHTPKDVTDSYGYYSHSEYVSDTNAPSISPIAFYHTAKLQKENIATTVLTVKGVASIFVGVSIIMTALFLSTSYIANYSPFWAIIAGIVSLFGQFINMLTHTKLIKEGYNRLKKRMFPK